MKPSRMWSPSDPQSRATLEPGRQRQGLDTPRLSPILAPAMMHFRFGGTT